MTKLSRIARTGDAATGSQPTAAAEIARTAADLQSLDRAAAAREPADDSSFTREQFWFLRQVAVNTSSALEAAFVMVDHANRKTGLMFVSQPSIKRILGRKDDRSVRDQIRVLERGEHIVFAGWVNLGAHANVKSYRWNLWDTRVEKRLDQDLLGVRPDPLRNNSSGAAHAHRKKNSGPKSSKAGRSGSFPPFAPDESCALVRKKTSGKPSEEPSDRTESTADALKATFEAFRETAKRLGVRIEPSVKKNWAPDLAELAAAGLDFAAHVLPVLEDWPVPDDPESAARATIRRLTELRGCADARRAELWAHDPANEWRLPDAVPSSDLAVETVELFRRAGWRPSEFSELFADYVRHFEEDFDWLDEADVAVELVLKAGNVPAAPPAFDSSFRYPASISDTGNLSTWPFL